MQIINLIISIIISMILFSVKTDQTGQTFSTQTLYRNLLTSTEQLELQARTAEIVPVNDTLALKLDGLALLPGDFSDALIEVEVMAQNPCYPGIAFHYADSANYELAYAVPHISGRMDAIQYDPVFNYSNTWQIYNGPAFQAFAEIPMNSWFTLRITIVGSRAAIQVNDLPPLVVEELAHGYTSGRIGLWSYRPALFRNLRIAASPAISDSGDVAAAPEGVIAAWRTVDGREWRCEANGALNINRYQTPSPEPMRLLRHFELSDSAEVVIGFGFSDELALFLDDSLLFQGTNTFVGFKDIASRGWVRPDMETITVPLPAGRHHLTAEVTVTEPFGWGLAVTLRVDNDGVELFP